MADPKTARSRHPVRPGHIVAAGLLIALSCGPLRRLAYEDFGGRDVWQDPERVVEVLVPAAGARVADIGAGGGYFAFRLAGAVGPEGRVYAIDVDPDMTDYLESQARERELRNIDVVLATSDDPGLPPDGVDLIFTANTYHHLGNRTAYFERARSFLRPGGRVAIIDFHEEGTRCAHSTPPETIREEMRAAGYRLEQSHEFLERQSFQVFALASP